ncbi:unnamed protein product, partial [Larinioides sclopetarius]
MSLRKGYEYAAGFIPKQRLHQSIESIAVRVRFEKYYCGWPFFLKSILRLSSSIHRI